MIDPLQTDSPMPLESLNYVPAFVRAGLEADFQHPIRCLLEAFETNLHRAETIASESRLLFDPKEIVWLFDPDQVNQWKRGDWELEFLQWLSSLLALELDQDWLVPQEEAGRSGTQLSGSSVERYAKARNIIARAAGIYGQRGTPSGLKNMLEVFYGWNVQILEHSWPQGMVIGGSSVVGAGSWLMDEPDLDRSFTVVVLLNDSKSKPPQEPGIRITSSLVGESRTESIDWLLGRENVEDIGKTATTNKAENERSWVASVKKLREVIDREKPAHTCYFLGLKSVPRGETPPTSRAMLLGINSVIEDFCMN
jgi:hypothetical protein